MLAVGFISNRLRNLRIGFRERTGHPVILHDNEILLGEPKVGRVPILVPACRGALHTYSDALARRTASRVAIARLLYNICAVISWEQPRRRFLRKHPGDGSPSIAPDS